MAKAKNVSYDQTPGIQSQGEQDPFLHKERAHKDWYKRGQMGNMGDKRGYLPKEVKKKTAKKK